MKEKLITYFNRQLHYMDLNPDGRPAYFSQAFGALDFAMEMLNDWDKEAELIDLWNNEWKLRLEEKVYEVR